ncbi:MAG: hypothetical protein DBY37_12395 [Desulfovibrionaceae bacterium]|nr:MAG: hypothetical protein DBY37_12395 [Desulfovibrionaceae bacterium]
MLRAGKLNAPRPDPPAPCAAIAAAESGGGEHRLHADGHAAMCRGGVPPFQGAQAPDARKAASDMRAAAAFSMSPAVFARNCFSEKADKIPRCVRGRSLMRAFRS